MRTNLVPFFLGAGLQLLSVGRAIEDYEDMVPNNALLTYRGREWEGSGHTTDEGPEVGLFGGDFATTEGADPWLSICGRCGALTLCEFDSDGDGQSNGLEMGDPCCQWRVGDPATGVPSGLISHPGFADATTSATQPAADACPPRIVVGTQPSASKRATSVVAVAAVWLVVVVLSAIVVRCARRSAVAEKLRYSTLGPAWRVRSVVPLTSTWWFQTIDFLGLRDVPTEAMLLSPAQLLVLSGLIIGVIAAAALSIGAAMQRNVPSTTRLALGSGHAAELLYTLTVIPITRNSMWIHVFGLSFERGIKFHRWFARLAIIATVVHLAAMVHSGYDAFETISYAQYTGGNLYGTLALVAALLLLVTSIEPVRRRLFEAFYIVHLPLAFAALLLAALHAPLLKLMLILPAMLYAIDLVARIYLGRFRGARIASIATVRSGADGCSITQLEVEFTSGTYSHEAGGYCWLNIPAVSLLQWHPFSVTYLVDAKRILFHIKAAPDSQSSSQIADRVRAGQRVYVDGPYGHPGVPPGDYDAHLYVSGGIGVTPMLSLAQEAARRESARVSFCWAVRHIEAAALIVPLLEDIHRAARGRVQYTFFHTAGKGTAPDHHLQEPQNSNVNSNNRNSNNSNSNGMNSNGMNNNNNGMNNNNNGNSRGRSSATIDVEQRDSTTDSSTRPSQAQSGSGSRGYYDSYSSSGGPNNNTSNNNTSNNTSNNNNNNNTTYGSSSYADDGGGPGDLPPGEGAVVGPVPTSAFDIERRLAAIGTVLYARPSQDIFARALAHAAESSGTQDRDTRDRDTRDRDTQQTKVAVFACGPEPLLDLVTNGARTESAAGPAQFFVHTETFLL
jgi:predicted ferric reductase